MPAPPGDRFHEGRHRRSPAKAKTINKYLGKDYDVYASFGHVRDLTPRTDRSIPDNDFAMRWEVDAKAAKRLSDIGGAVKNADNVILATDPDREGEAISWHVYEILKAKRSSRTSGSTASCSTRSPRRRCRTRCAIRARSTRRWSTPIAPAARSTTSSASTCRRCCGASCRARARQGGCSRLRYASSATARSRSRSLLHANIGRSSPHLKTLATRPSPRGWSAPTARRSAASTSAPARRPRILARPRSGEVLGGFHRGETRQAPPLPALHHLDPAAGSVAQTRLGAGAHHADRATALRGRRRRRRRSRPHYLYAHRRRRPRARGGECGAKSDRQRFWRSLCPQRAAKIHGQSQERPGGARGYPPHRHDSPPQGRGSPPRARAGKTLRAHLDAHHRLPDGERRTRAHHRRNPCRSGRARLEFRANGQVVRFPDSSRSTRRAATTRRTRTGRSCRR